MKLLVTGGAGFIGSALCRHLIQKTPHHVANIDALTYASNLSSLKDVEASDRYTLFVKDIADELPMQTIMDDYKPDAIIHLAAESHVDRSIADADAFIKTNIVGTYTLLKTARSYWLKQSMDKKASFRFLHVSTDEVYGSCRENEYFTEATSYAPSSPYSASKAASEHLVSAWVHTYGFPAIITNCSNNYGPYQFTEKMIPLMIKKAFDRKPLPVYGDGSNIRDWLYVDDHVKALLIILASGRIGETYTIGARNERSNLDIVNLICEELDRIYPERDSHRNLITFVSDRPGHDTRYAIDATKLESELGWRAEETFETGIRKTILWYLENISWWSN